MEDEFTEKEAERQDCVDSAIANLIAELIPDDSTFDWDIELVGEVRDALQEVIVDRMGAMTEQEFYPYRELKPVKPKEPVFPENTIYVTDEQLSTAIKNTVDELDVDDLCSIAEEFLGGKCYRAPNGDYAFIPNIWYGGAFDYLREKK